jgi:hypothetical protein
LSDPTDRVRTLEPSFDDGAIDLTGSWRPPKPKSPAGRVGKRRNVAGSARRPVAAGVSPDTVQALQRGEVDSRMLEALAHPNAAIQPVLLTDVVPVDVLRRALGAAYGSARRAGDAPRVEQVLAAADTIEARRSALIERLLIDCYLNYPGLEEGIIAIVEGGATQGDVEYQGIFGDVDFTVFTVDSSDELWRVSEALANSFAWTGYPLTPNGQNSVLDLHVFVQCVKHPDAAGNPGDPHGLTCELPLRRQIGARNPERFVSEVGVRWIVNQMYFAGRPLRGMVENACLPAHIAPHEAVAFATDVTCHLGPALMDALSPELNGLARAVQRERLTSALNAAKHVLRLVDAWLIHHPQGNQLYQKRFKEPRQQTCRTSYHARVVDDALLLLGRGQAGRVLRAGDEILLRDLAMLKQRTRCFSPWDLLGYDERASERATDLVHRMHELVRRILREITSRS